MSSTTLITSQQRRDLVILMTAFFIVTMLCLWLLVRDATTETRIKNAVNECVTTYEQEFKDRGFRPEWSLSEEIIKDVINYEDKT